MNDTNILPLKIKKNNISAFFKKSTLMANDDIL